MHNCKYIIYNNVFFFLFFLFGSPIDLMCSQKSEMRCLLPRSLLDQGFFPKCPPPKESNDKCTASQVCNYSWSGQRKMPSYVNNLVFPEDFLTSLRTIAMREDELYHVSSLLEEVRISQHHKYPPTLPNTPQKKKEKRISLYKKSPST